MFYKAENFNQPLDSWDVSNVRGMNGIFNQTNLSTSNYDTTLIGWSQLELQNYIDWMLKVFHIVWQSLHAKNLIDNFTWRITDGGLNCQ